MVKIITTGGTISSGSSSTDPTLATVDDETRVAFETALRAVFGVDTEFKTAYCIDSQKFDLNFHGPEVLRILKELHDADPSEDVIITTGTDTIKWLSNLVAISEKMMGSKRKVVIASSMMNKDAPDGKEHISGILQATNKFLTNDSTGPGVYVASAQDRLAEKVIFYGLNAPDDRIAKFSSASLGAVCGTNPAFTAKLIEPSQLIEPSHKSYKVSSESISEDKREEKLRRQEALLEKERMIISFCGEAKMTLFPTLAQSDPELIAKYYKDLKEGDLAICEIDQGWFKGGAKRVGGYLKMLEDLSSRGVKVLLCNRKYHDAKEEELVSEGQINALERFVARYDAGKNIKVYDSLPTTSLYTKLAFEGFLTEGGEGVSAGGGGASAGAGGGSGSSEAAPRDLSPDVSVAVPGAIGVRYIPNFKIFEKTYERFFDFSLNAILIEALACAVIPRELLSVMQKVRSDLSDKTPPCYVFLTPPYKEEDSTIKYDASAQDKDLIKLDICRMGDETAREFMRDWHTREAERVITIMTNIGNLMENKKLDEALILQFRNEIAGLLEQDAYSKNKAVSSILFTINSHFENTLSVVSGGATATPLAVSREPSRHLP
jgi:hypothetical protein